MNTLKLKCRELREIITVTKNSCMNIGINSMKKEEFLLNEPDVLIHIHFFIIESLLCNLDNIGFFVFHKVEKIFFSDELKNCKLYI